MYICTYILSQVPIKVNEVRLEKGQNFVLCTSYIRIALPKR